MMLQRSNGKYADGSTTVVVGPIGTIVLAKMREKEAAANRQESLNFVGLNLAALSGQGGQI